MTDKKWCVYVHTNKHNGKKYVGVTSNSVNVRWQNGRGYKNCTLFNEAIKKYGWEGFEHEIIESRLTEKEAKSLECLYIGIWNTKDKEFGYNLTYGGDGTRGVERKPISKETRTKMIMARKSRKRDDTLMDKIRYKKRMNRRKRRYAHE